VTRGVVEALRNDMPPVPGEASLVRVRATAVRKHANRRTGFRAHPWRTAGGAVTVLALVAALAIVLTPRADTSAFAADEAVDALLLQTDGKVLHIEGTFTKTGENDREGHRPRFDIDQRESYWIDPARNAMRIETINVADGSLDNVSVQVDDTIVVFQDNIRYGTGESPQLVQYTGEGMLITSVMGGMVDFLRASIAEGSAEPIGTEIIDGEEYWVVEWRGPLDPPFISDVLTATMRTSDYHIRSWSRKLTYINGDGHGTETMSGTFDVIEELDPATLPADFFTLESVIAIAGPDVPLTVQEYMPPPDE
jgi:hypothetical protein